MTIQGCDECGFSERVKALYGYSPVGQPCIVHNSGSWYNHSLLMAVFSTGRKEYFIFCAARARRAAKALSTKVRSKTLASSSASSCASC